MYIGSLSLRLSGDTSNKEYVDGRKTRDYIDLLQHFVNIVQLESQKGILDTDSESKRNARSAYLVEDRCYASYPALYFIVDWNLFE